MERIKAAIDALKTDGDFNSSSNVRSQKLDGLWDLIFGVVGELLSRAPEVAPAEPLPAGSGLADAAEAFIEAIRAHAANPNAETFALLNAAGAVYSGQLASQPLVNGKQPDGNAAIGSGSVTGAAAGEVSNEQAQQHPPAPADETTGAPQE